jgi:hypothetical protein
MKEATNEAALLVLWVQDDLIGFQICDDDVEQGDCSPIVNTNQSLLVVRDFDVDFVASVAHVALHSFLGGSASESLSHRRPGRAAAGDVG